MNKYSDRKFTDLVKSKRFVSLVVTTLVSLFVYFSPEGAAHRELILESLYPIVFLVIAAFGLEDVVEKLADKFYGVWEIADDLVNEDETTEVNVNVEK